MTKHTTQRVVFQPAAGQGLKRGIDTMVSAIRPTLGPLPRQVAMQRVTGGLPELLDDGGVIARRILELPDRDADMGAMLVRHLVWRVHERGGDGTATAAVIFQSLYHQGLTYLTSGGNAMVLRRHLENGLRLVVDHLAGMATPMEGQAALTQAALSVCNDPPLAGMMGEILDMIGEYGRLELRKGQGRDLVREYIEGSYWDGGFMAREMITDHARGRIDLEDPAIFMSNLTIKSAQDIIPLLTMCLDHDVHNLVIICRELPADAIAMLVAPRNRARLLTLAVKTPTYALAKPGVLEDLAFLTGGRALLEDAGQTLDSLTFEDLGRARLAWADKDYFGVVGGHGDPVALRKHAEDMRKLYRNAENEDDRKLARQRLGQLMGGAATLWVGGLSDNEIEARKDLAERTAEAVRNTLIEGIVPGGGAALLACQPVLRERMRASTDADERAAYGMLIRALEEPARTIIANAGQDTAETMAHIRAAGPGFGYDANTDCVVDMQAAGIYDSTAVVKLAASSAISTAALALTTDVLVHHKKRVDSVEP